MMSFAEYEKAMKEVWMMTKNMKIVLDSLQDPIYAKVAPLPQPKANIIYYLDAMRTEMQNCLNCWDAEGNYISN